ncbi:MAG: hypothetical protein Q7Q73_11955 [Verrucomicrobiota bacterium JB024]|nr:hypothetical protein [Verrucomicrobiota bacterium JB024]
MRASSLLLFSAGLSLASTLGYYFYSRQAEPSPDGAPGSQAQSELDDIADELERQIDQFDPENAKSNTARQLADLLQLENDVMSDLDGKPAPIRSPKNKQASPSSEPEASPSDSSSAPTEPSLAQTPAEPQTDTVEAPETPPPALNPTDLQTLLGEATPLSQRTVLYGKPYPYRLLVPAGWKILFNEPDRCALAYEDAIFVFVETGPWNTTQEEWARKSLEDLQTAYSGMRLIGQKQLEIDARPWQQLFLREPTTVLASPREIMLLTYGERKRGSYRLVITGQAHALDRHVEAINQLISTWHFPPDNYQPENASTVRIYVDGKRQYF